MSGAGRSIPRAPSGPFQLRALVGVLRARLARGSHGQLSAETGARAGAAEAAGALATQLPKRSKFVGTAIDRQLAVVGAIELVDLAHLVQPREHPQTDAHRQRVWVCPVAFLVVVVVRRKNGQAAFAVAAVDDVID